MRILAIKSNLDHHQVVNMFQVIANHLLGVSGAAIVDDKVPRGPNSNLVSNMAWEDKLSIVPANLNLQALSK